MKITKFVVVSNSRSVGMFPVVTEPGLFVGWNRAELLAEFADEPVLYKLSHARFMVRELRRSGYYVSARPYVLYALRNFIQRIRERTVRRRLAKAEWRK